MEDSPEYSERLTVTLPKRLSGRLRSEASASGRPLSNIVRDAVERYYAEQKPLPLPPFVGIGRSGRPDNSTRVNEIVAAEIERRHPRHPR